MTDYQTELTVALYELTMEYTKLLKKYRLQNESYNDLCEDFKSISKKNGDLLQLLQNAQNFAVRLWEENPHDDSSGFIKEWNLRVLGERK